MTVFAERDARRTCTKWPPGMNVAEQRGTRRSTTRSAKVGAMHSAKHHSAKNRHGDEVWQALGEERFSAKSTPGDLLRTRHPAKLQHGEYVRRHPLGAHVVPSRRSVFAECRRVPTRRSSDTSLTPI